MKSAINLNRYLDEVDAARGLSSAEALLRITKLAFSPSSILTPRAILISIAALAYGAATGLDGDAEPDSDDDSAAFFDEADIMRDEAIDRRLNG